MRRRSRSFIVGGGLRRPRVSDVLKLEASINGGADRPARAAACGAQTWWWHLGLATTVELIVQM